MNGSLRKYPRARREHKNLECRPIGLTKMKGKRDEQSQCLINRLTYSNNKHLIFCVTRKADNFYVALKVSSFYNLLYLQEKYAPNESD